jgi:endonuclease-8
VPEGDTIHYAANRIRPVLLGEVPGEIEAPQPRHRMDRWPQKLADREVVGVDVHGKHLFLAFEGGLTMHSHLRMTGSWRVHAIGERWGRSPRRAWLRLRAKGHDVIQFDGPMLELMTTARMRLDQRIAGLGPDIVKDDFDEAKYLRRLREDDPTRPFGDTLLDQRVVAGIGNLWKVETCFAIGVSPWRPTGDVTDEEALEAVRWAHPRMRSSALEGNQSRFKRIYATTGRTCPRCGEAKIQRRGQWDDNRTTYWCPACQR